MEEELKELKDMLNSVLIGMASIDKKFDIKFEAMEKRMGSTESKLDSIKSDITDIKLGIETEIKPHIKLLAEGFEGYTERLPQIDQMAEDIHDTKLQTDVIAAVIERQGKDIKNLKVIK